MKKCIITLSAVAFLCLACSPDEVTPYSHQVEASTLPKVDTPILPTNSQNPYDDMGRVYLKSLYGTTSGMVISKTLSHQITESRLNQEIQASLLGFIKSSCAIQDNGYSRFYRTIVDYESKVLDHPEYKSTDKKTILSYTAMIRYASYPGDIPQSTSEIDDEDWDLSTPNATRDTILDQKGKQDTESLAPFSGIKPIQEP
ncbi:MAG: hypothetical protein CMH46_16660 [Muricauda sp.]|nr:MULTISPECIES: hypothetical protein [unclassified Allomuricauda]MAU17161.1 hypothetical protein [Allomuricauda sp.]|tara:strand:+ start:1197 stop:1796 length:600 start_codon:yes stop_codon:yes gene_type:complete